MNIVYIGTPDYACVPLEALVSSGHFVKLVITQPDRPKDRGKKLGKSPVKIKAEELGIKVITPERLKENEEVFEEIRDSEPDFIVVYSYGKILPLEILKAPKYECLNIHASILPKYRGAAPIHRAVLDGEKETGVTLMRMEEGLDTGDIFAVSKTDIGRKTSADLYRELSEMGAELLLSSLPGIAAGELKAVPQEGKSCYAEMVYKKDGEIDWSRTSEEIDRLIRAFNDFPVAWTRLGGDIIKIFESEPLGKAYGLPGEVVGADKNGILVSCGNGSLLIKRLQAPGKKAMDSASYLLGNKIEIGTMLG